MQDSSKFLNRKKVLLIANILFTTLLLISALGFYFSAKASIESEGGKLVFISEPKPIDLKKQYVQIIGLVNRPGIYEFQSGARVFEIIEMAGGISDSDKIDLTSVNLVREVRDGEIILLLDASQNTTNDSTSLSVNIYQGKININSADLQELTSLPGIGIATAEKIVQARPFASLEDIMRVSGIGTVKYSKIVDLIEI